MSVTTMSKEERENSLKLAREAREQKIKDGEYLRKEYSDLSHWKMLASKYKVRLPPNYIPASEIKYVGRAFRKHGVEVKGFLKVLV